jgi:RecB family endonuclease NucS
MPGGRVVVRSQVIVMFARASARYTGRIDAELSAADVVIMIRDSERGGDGSVLIHDAFKGLQPRNWMPAGSVMTRTPDSLLFNHDRRGERLEIYLHEIHHEQAFTPELASTLSKLGREQECSDLLAEHLHLLSGDLTLVAREFRTPAGPVDLLCTEWRDVDGRQTQCPVVIEVKRVAVDTNTVYQARRYLDALQRTEWAGVPARGVLVAPTLRKPAEAVLEDHDVLTFERVKFQDLLPPAPKRR